MNVYIDYNGKTYESIEFPPEQLNKLKDYIYENMDKLTKLTLDLKDGGKLVVGKSVIQNCVIMFK